MDLDTILFDTPDPERSEKLQAFLDQEEPVRVRLVGKDKPVTVFALGRQFTVPPEGIVVTPKAAIELLYLWGRQGIYRGIDPVTGHSRGNIHLVEPTNERPRIAARIVDWYLTAQPEDAKAAPTPEVAEADA